MQAKFAIWALGTIVAAGALITALGAEHTNHAANGCPTLPPWMPSSRQSLAAVPPSCGW